MKTIRHIGCLTHPTCNNVESNMQQHDADLMAKLMQLRFGCISYLLSVKVIEPAAYYNTKDYKYISSINDRRFSSHSYLKCTLVEYKTVQRPAGGGTSGWWHQCVIVLTFKQGTMRILIKKFPKHFFQK